MSSHGRRAAVARTRRVLRATRQMALQSDVRGEKVSNGVGAASRPPQFAAASDHQEEQSQRPRHEHSLGTDDPRPRSRYERRPRVHDDRQDDVDHETQCLQRRSTTVTSLRPVWPHRHHQNSVDREEGGEEERKRQTVQQLDDEERKNALRVVGVDEQIQTPETTATLVMHR